MAIALGAGFLAMLDGWRTGAGFAALATAGSLAPEHEILNPSRGGAGRKLIILLHGFTQGPSNLEALAQALRDTMPDAAIWRPRLPLGLLSMADPEAITRDVAAKLDKLVINGQYQEIIVAGHSCGAVLAQKLYLIGWGAEPSGSIPLAPAHTWVKLVRRIVLIAAVNRGWMVRSAMGPGKAVAFRLGSVLRYLLPLEPVIFGVARGAPFLTTLRLQWSALQERKPAPIPLTVQLLGTIDDLVSPEDGADLWVGRHFVYLTMPESGHLNITQVDDTPAGQTRRSLLVAAFHDPLEQLRQRPQARSLDDLKDMLPGATDDLDEGDGTPASTDAPDAVVFVIHGIRDRGFWTKKLAWELKREARPRTVRTVTSTYGYFPMLSFGLPWTRRAKVTWLLDQYAQARAIYGHRTPFHYLGHSNGTYLLAQALRLCPTMRVERVVFAGSVVNSDYDWHARIRAGQVQRVLNLIATADSVVALFPRGLRQLWLARDLGGAGHDGFDATKGNVSQILVLGGHNAGVAERHWRALVAFLLKGVIPLPDCQVGDRPLWAKVLASIAPILLLLLTAIVLLLLALPLLPLGAAAGWAIAFTLIVLLLGLILTRI